MSTEHHGSPLLMKELTSDTRNNIISLDQKLRGLRAEVEAKLRNNSLQFDTPNQELDTTMNNLLSEINQALESISTLVNATMDDVANPEFFQSDEMNTFNQNLTQFLTRIKQINFD